MTACIWHLLAMTNIYIIALQYRCLKPCDIWNRFLPQVEASFQSLITICSFLPIGSTVSASPDLRVLGHSPKI